MISFVALEKFDPSNEGWEKYVEWAQLPQLREVISLDCSLCPSILNELNDEDWKNISKKEKSFFGLFSNLDYLLKRISGFKDLQISAVSKNPKEASVSSFADSRFQFKGFDLVEDETRISALTNCGGFPKAFSNDELSDCGLILTYERAKEIQQDLLKNYPDEDHADCSFWAIWKMVDT